MRWCVAALICVWVFAPATTLPGQNTNWPSFRGTNACGVQDGHPTPVTWNVVADDDNPAENVAWKTPIPGLSHSCPIVWGDRLFVTTAVSAAGKQSLRVGLYGQINSVDEDAAVTWLVYCLDRNTGKVVWKRTACEGVPKVKRHTKATHANCTMATDGKHAVAFFGSEGLYCYSLDGKLEWKKDLGVLDSAFFRVPTARWGFGSSPIIHDGAVIVQCDVMKDSFLAAFDLDNGKEIWRTPRKDVPTWSTPTVHRQGHRTLLLVNGWKHIGGYDAKTGKEVWRLTGGGDIPTPTPVVAHDLVFITSAHGGMRPIYAIRLTADGELAQPTEEEPGEHIAWFKKTEGSYMPTPLVYGDHLYVCRDNGVLSCYVAKTGERLYRRRIKAGGQAAFTASGVAADGKLYYASENGTVYVVQAGEKYELLARNKMGEVCMASPAVSAGKLYFRTRHHVMAIGDTTQ